MFRKKKEDNQRIELIRQFSDKEVELLKTLLRIHKDEIELFKLNEIGSQSETKRHPYGKGKIPYIPPKRKDRKYKLYPSD